MWLCACAVVCGVYVWGVCVSAVVSVVCVFVCVCVGENVCVSENCYLPGPGTHRTLHVRCVCVCVCVCEGVCVQYSQKSPM